MMRWITQLWWSESEMHPASQRPGRVDEALLCIAEKGTIVFRQAVVVQKVIIVARAFNLFVTPFIKQLPLHPIQHLVAFKTSPEKFSQLPSLLDMIIDDKKFPIADSGRHVKTAGSTSRPTVNPPAFLLHFADGVDEVIIV
jgi:hypothetical protein